MPDTALDFWSELLALLRCEPLARDAARRPMRPTRAVAIRGTACAGSRRSSACGWRAQAQPAGGVASGGQLKTGHRRGRADGLAGRARALDRRAADARRRQPLRGGRPQPSRRPPAPAAHRERPRWRWWQSAAEPLPAEHPATPLLLVQAAVLSIGRGEAAPRPRRSRASSSCADALTPPRARARGAGGGARRDRRAAAKPDELLARGRAALALQARRAGAPGAVAAARRAADRPAGRSTTRSPCWDRRRTATTPIGRYIAFQADGGARARRPARRAAGRGARGAGPPRRTPTSSRIRR